MCEMRGVATRVYPGSVSRRCRCSKALTRVPVLSLPSRSRRIYFRTLEVGRVVTPSRPSSAKKTGTTLFSETFLRRSGGSPKSITGHRGPADLGFAARPTPAPRPACRRPGPLSGFGNGRPVPPAAFPNALHSAGFPSVLSAQPRRATCPRLPPSPGDPFSGPGSFRVAAVSCLALHALHVCRTLSGPDHPAVSSGHLQLNASEAERAVHAHDPGASVGGPQIRRL